MTESQAPVLLLGFNRPEMLANLVSSLAESQPRHLIFNIDGPRIGSSTDAELVRRTQACTESVNWDCKIETRFHSINLGLRTSVAEAVSWAVHSYGKAIVIEDDVVVGSKFLPFMNMMLQKFSDDERVGHINGYNVAPTERLSHPTSNIRLSRYIESFAWGTWQRSWKLFDESLAWGRGCSLSDLKNIVGTYAGAVRWKINFSDAESDRINSWAYRWLASLWENDIFALSPNVNLVSYHGNEDGTHVFRKPRWTDFPLTDFPRPLEEIYEPIYDEKSDRWLAKNVFAESPFGVVDGLATSLALELRQKYRQLRN